jgi:hypothetical protein
VGGEVRYYTVEDAVLVYDAELLGPLEAPRPPTRPSPAEPTQPADPDHAQPEREDPERSEPEKVEPDRVETQRVEPTPSVRHSWWREFFGFGE